MIRTLKFAAFIALAAVPAASFTCQAQAQAVAPALGGTRLDVVASGEVTISATRSTGDWPFGGALTVIRRAELMNTSRKFRYDIRG